MAAEVGSNKVLTFDEKRSEVFEAYTHKRLWQALSFKDVPPERAVRQSLILSGVQSTLSDPCKLLASFWEGDKEKKRFS